MIKYVLAVTAFCLILSACAGQAPEEPRMTQAVETESSAALPSESSIPPPEPSLLASDEESASETAEISEYYIVKAQIDAAELDMEILEAKYRIGELEAASFEEQRTSQSAQKKELENRKRLLEEPSFEAADSDDLADMDMNALLIKLEEYEVQEEQLERKEDQLEAAYLAGELAREGFVEEQTKLLYDDDMLDGKKDRVEDYLEKLGWDD